MTCQNCGHPKNRHTEFMPKNRCIGSPTTDGECSCPAYREPEPAVTDLPDAVVEAVAEVLYNRQLMPDETPWHLTSDLDREEPREDARAALAAASGPWAEHLDTANAETERQGRLRGLAEETMLSLREEVAAALARLKAREDDVDRLIDERDALRAELASLRDRVTALADAAVYADFGEYHPDGDGNEEIVLGVRESELRAIVRGSDDEAGEGA